MSEKSLMRLLCLANRGSEIAHRLPAHSIIAAYHLLLSEGGHRGLRDSFVSLIENISREKAEYVHMAVVYFPTVPPVRDFTQATRLGDATHGFLRGVFRGLKQASSAQLQDSYHFDELIAKDQIIQVLGTKVAEEMNRYWRIKTVDMVLRTLLLSGKTRALPSELVSFGTTYVSQVLGQTKGSIGRSEECVDDSPLHPPDYAGLVNILSYTSKDRALLDQIAARLSMCDMSEPAVPESAIREYSRSRRRIRKVMGTLVAEDRRKFSDTQIVQVIRAFHFAEYGSLVIAEHFASRVQLMMESTTGNESTMLNPTYESELKAESMEWKIELDKDKKPLSLREKLVERREKASTRTSLPALKTWKDTMSVILFYIESGAVTGPLGKSFAQAIEFFGPAFKNEVTLDDLAVMFQAFHKPRTSFSEKPVGAALMKPNRCIQESESGNSGFATLARALQHFAEILLREARPGQKDVVTKLWKWCSPPSPATPDSVDPSFAYPKFIFASCRFLQYAVIPEWGIVDLNLPFPSISKGISKWDGKQYGNSAEGLESASSKPNLISNKKSSPRATTTKKKSDIGATEDDESTTSAETMGMIGPWGEINAIIPKLLVLVKIACRNEESVANRHISESGVSPVTTNENTGITANMQRQDGEQTMNTGDEQAAKELLKAVKKAQEQLKNLKLAGETLFESVLKMPLAELENNLGSFVTTMTASIGDFPPNYSLLLRKFIVSLPQRENLEKHDFSPSRLSFLLLFMSKYFVSPSRDPDGGKYHRHVFCDVMLSTLVPRLATVYKDTRISADTELELIEERQERDGHSNSQWSLGKARRHYFQVRAGTLRDSVSLYLALRRFFIAGVRAHQHALREFAESAFLDVPPDEWNWLSKGLQQRITIALAQDQTYLPIFKISPSGISEVPLISQTYKRIQELSEQKKIDSIRQGTDSNYTNNLSSVTSVPPSLKPSGESKEQSDEQANSGGDNKKAESSQHQQQSVSSSRRNKSIAEANISTTPKELAALEMIEYM